MSKYIQSLTNYLHDQGLLKDKLKSALQEHDEIFCSRPSKKLPFGKYKGKTISEINEFDSKYLVWLTRQTWCFDDIKEEIQNIPL